MHPSTLRPGQVWTLDVREDYWNRLIVSPPFKQAGNWWVMIEDTSPMWSESCFPYEMPVEVVLTWTRLL
jgi:hypothetical protein